MDHNYSPNELWEMLGAKVKREKNKKGVTIRSIYLDGECILYNAGYRLELVVSSILNEVVI